MTKHMYARQWAAMFTFHVRAVVLRDLLADRRRAAERILEAQLPEIMRMMGIAQPT